MKNRIVKQIKFRSSQDVKDFVFIISTLPRNVQVKLKCNNTVVDGKSILGVLSLSTNKIIEVIILSETDISEDKITRLINQWIVKE